ncbi:hypothetical protein FRC20_003433 [Serendipita sp. 405]|nr:hypothetical protein FRC20_003433 [Serendipita sp. 405]
MSKMIIDQTEEKPPPYDAHMNDSDEELAGSVAIETPSRINDHSSYSSYGRGLESHAKVTQDGRLNIRMNIKKNLPDLPSNYANPIREFAVDPALSRPVTGPREGGLVPKLSIVIMIVGSRGDVQPFLALGQELLRQGHRVRIATHGTFREFVKDSGLEFYNIGGDPHDLMSYMVRNPGLIPGWTSLTNGDIRRKQKMLAEILDGCWDACSQPDVDNKPFVADAIISNPPAFAHVHCAEALGIPLHLSFTMPWCPTTAFPHPLVNVSQSNAEPGLSNYLTYGLAEMMTWQGLGGVINIFRTKKLGLQPLSVRSGPGIVDRLKIPWTYCFSPEIVPKPEDWQNHIDVVGFYFLDLASNYAPPMDLVNFLESGPPPVYIGFGSVVVEDPEEMTRTIFEATEKAGVRAVVSAGWGGLGGTAIPSHIFILGNCPHDWLFTKVAAVCHHGGAGTTAIGLRLGKPTIVVPFFGDQPFWGSMIFQAGAGPKPIKKEKMGVDRLCAAIEFCMTEEAKVAAAILGEKIRAQEGVKNGVKSFHQHLPVLNMRCDLLPHELAVWWSAEHCLKLSAIAAQVLHEEKLLNVHKLDIHRSKEYDTRTKTTAKAAITGSVVELFRSVTSFSEGLVQMLTEPKQGLINTSVAIPRSMVHILDTFTDGFANAPTLYGSTVREPGRTKNFTSGLKEGGKAFFFGVSDGITGLWTEPVEGYKEKGWKGAMEGHFRSYANLAIRPTAGAFGLITYPLRGALMSLYKQDAATERHLRQLRIDQGRDAAAQSPIEPKGPVFPPPYSSPAPISAQEPESSDEPSKKKSKKSKKISIVERDSDFEKHLRSLHQVQPGTPALTDQASRAEIVALFKAACKKENLKMRKKAMQKRIQWIITKGGAGTITELTPGEEQYFAGGQVTERRDSTASAEHKPEEVPIISSPKEKKLPAPPLPPRHSATSSQSYQDTGPLLSEQRGAQEEEEEALFSKQLEEAMKLSLADENTANEASTSKLPELQPQAVDHNESNYQILAAATLWSEDVSSPKISVEHPDKKP